jgi:hypothetical protein
MHNIPRRRLLLAGAFLAVFLIAVIVHATSHGTPETRTTTQTNPANHTTPGGRPPTPATTGQQADDSVDNDPTVHTDPTTDITPAIHAAEHFAVVVFNGTAPHQPEADYRAAVAALCTPDEAALLADQTGPPPGGRIDHARTTTGDWLGPSLAQVSVPVDVTGLDGGTGATLVLTLTGASGRWLVSDIDLVKAGQS